MLKKDQRKKKQSSLLPINLETEMSGKNLSGKSRRKRLFGRNNMRKRGNNLVGPGNVVFITSDYSHSTFTERRRCPAKSMRKGSFLTSKKENRRDWHIEINTVHSRLNGQPIHISSSWSPTISSWLSKSMPSPFPSIIPQQLSTKCTTTLGK